jgi:DNA-binding transcriptional ArsR family regulator
MQTNEYADRRVDRSERDAWLRSSFKAEADADAAAVLDTLTDPLCRRALACAATPVTAREVAECADLSMSTTYRKLDDLTDAGLLETQTELRDDGYHTTRYRATIEEATIHVDGEDGIHVSLQHATDDE